VYKRGYVTQVIRVEVDVPADGNVRLQTTSGDNMHTTCTRLDAIEQLFEPSLCGSGGMDRDAYRQSQVPDGRPLIRFCEDELEWLSGESADPKTKKATGRISEALKRGDLKDGEPLLMIGDQALTGS
jgi:hypothetical protein